MKVYLTLIGVVVTTNFSAQILNAKVEFVEGIVINKYLYHEGGFYCNMGSKIFYDNDTIPFIRNSRSNLSVLKLYPDLKESIGDITDYDFIHDFSCRIFKNNLTISEYDFHTQEKGQIVKSDYFYYKNSCCNLYTSYQFKGIIIIYTSDEEISVFPSEVIDVGEHPPCLCPYIDSNWIKFAILKEALELKPLAEKQIKDNSFIKTGIRSVNLLYCE